MAGAKYGRESEQAAATTELAEAWIEAGRLNNAEGRTGETAHYIPLDSIRVDETIFIREKLDEDAIGRYMLALDEMPEMVVQRHTFKLVTGRLRYEAARRLERSVVLVRELEAADADLWELAFRSNIENGVPLSYSERMSAARRCIDAHPDWSDALVAEWVGVNRSTVFRWRDRTSPAVPVPPGQVVAQLEEPAKRVGRDGRTRAATQRKATGEPVEPPPLIDQEWLKTLDADTANQQAGPSPLMPGDLVIGGHKGEVVYRADGTVVTRVDIDPEMADLVTISQVPDLVADREVDPFRELVKWVLINPPGDLADAMPSSLAQAALAEGVMLEAWVRQYVERLKERIVGLVSPGHA